MFFLLFDPLILIIAHHLGEKAFGRLWCLEEPIWKDDFGCKLSKLSLLSNEDKKDKKDKLHPNSKYFCLSQIINNTPTPNDPNDENWWDLIDSNWYNLNSAIWSA